jgi:hypothetical protein
MAEPAGDIIMTCSGPLVGAQTGAQTISLVVNGTPITSRQLYTGAAPASIPTEAALLVNDVTTTATQGFLQSGVLVFSGILLPTSGSPFTLRLTNLRVNANAVASGTFVTGTVLATFPIQNQSNLALGVVESSLSVSVSSPIPSSSGCQSFSTPIAILTIGELVNTAFKSPASSSSNSTAAGWYQTGVNTESQTVLSPTPAGWTNQTGAVPGRADNATRIRVNFANIPAGVTVLMPLTVVSSAGTGTLTATSSGDIGAFNQVTGAAIPITSSGSVTYEVRAQSSNSIDSFPFSMTISSAGNTGAGLILVSATYAGTSAEASTSIPVFVDTSVLSPLFDFLGCSTTYHLTFTQQPSRGPVGTPISPVAVQIQDVNGFLVTSSAAITVASTPAGASATVSAVNGIAAFSNDLVFSAAGTYVLSVTSSGFGSGTGSPMLIAGQATATTLTSSANPSTYGQSVILTATVSPSSATGIVTFYDGTTILGTKALAGGSAALTINLPASGVRSLTAIYSGDATYAPSISPTLTQTVNAVAEGGFAAPVSYGTGTTTQSVAVGDFNGDGNADLVTANQGSGNVSVLLGNGDGSFRTAVNYAAGSNSASVAVGDFNGDGKPDLVVVNLATNNVSVLLGNGDGTFQTAVSHGIGNSVNSVAVADFNGDGKADLVVATSNGMSVLLGNGDGTFKAPATYEAGLVFSLVAVGDFNGDGKPDIIAANGTAVSVLLGVGDGTFQTPVNFAVAAGTNLESIAVADLNGDGKSDFVVANCCVSVSVFLSNGNGTFQKTATYAVGAAYVTLADFNGDGKPDIITDDSGLSVLLGNGNGTFQAAVNYSAAAPSGVIAGGEFNGDGRADFAIANFSGNTVSVVPGTAPQLKFTTQPASSGAGTVLPSVVVQVQDSNGNAISSSSAAVTLTSTPVAINVTVNAVNGAATFRGLDFATPGSYTLTAASGGLASVTSNTFNIAAYNVAFPMTGTRVGVFRNGAAFLEDSNGNGVYDPGVDRYLPSFTGPGGSMTGDVGVVGDWTGDGRAKAGVYRTSTGTWYLDANNDGVYDAGDYTYQFGGLPGDIPFAGDWMGLGKSCIGIYRSVASDWLLDLNCNGSFDNTPTDAFFPFGGLAGDVPVVGNWGGTQTRVGVVRSYAPNGVPVGPPFFWVLDGNAANAGNLPANHQPGTYCFAYGGLPGDVFVVGDWYNTGTSTAGVYRAGYWVLDAALPGAPQASHVSGLAFPYGGLASDVPITGKW